ncbi:hypothetical protein FB562_1173 [Homoserinimonas aerilata]|uniref:DUF3592 domain-containing protein n=1 Tax=Homoserinimonas aerilata TaxID=1162970 RepID=A0A542YJ44_9MICO|nr:hypothetical protein [Homoserinimonas aerilata]TQL48092.1 hypothetical protein FB562_1173 [Homoserinimonas aerilata]
MSGSDFLGPLLELFSWIGLTLGAACLVVALIIRAVSGRWVETTAVVVHESGSAAARWLADDGTIHSRPLDPAEAAQLTASDDVMVFVSVVRPERMRLHRRGGGEQTLMFLALLLGGVGIVASVASFVLQLIPE